MTDQAVFSEYYEVRGALKTIALPKVLPVADPNSQLDSGEDVYATCGDIIYSITSPAPSILPFSNFVFDRSNADKPTI